MPPSSAARPSLIRTAQATLLALLPLTLLPLVGCADDEQLKGPPELKKFLVLGAGGEPVDLLAPPPDGGAPALSPVSSFKVVFNRLLVGANIETVTGSKVEGKTDVARLTWMGAPAGATAITAITTYNSGGALDVKTPGPSILIAARPGLPSGARLELRLDRTKILGKNGGQAYLGPDVVTAQTEPFTVTIGVEEGKPVAPSFTLKITFSNLPEEQIARRIKVTENGAEIPVEVKKDADDPRVRIVAPGAGAGWTVGRRYAVTVAAEAADLFGVTLGAAISRMFTVALAAGDGSAPPADAGADASGRDAGTDASAVDAVDAAGAVDGHPASSG